jgi:DNA-binding transcriptional LysR family regulator
MAHGMELRHLRSFIAVADQGSITAAAGRLRITQPALSRQLRALEHDIGFPLVDRSARGVVLTDVGTGLLAEARSLVAQADAALKAARARGRGTLGELQLGYAPSPTAQILPPALQAFERVATDVKVILHDLGGDELLDTLERGRLHLAIMVDPGGLLPANLIFRPLARYAQCVAFRSRHPFARLKHVPLARLAREPLVVYERRHYAEYLNTLLAVLGPVTNAPRITVECDGLTSLIAAVLAGRGVAVVPEVFGRFAGDGIRLRPIAPPPAELVIGYAHRADVPLPPSARRLIDILVGLGRRPRAGRSRARGPGRPQS